jgi:hypothetical protein
MGNKNIKIYPNYDTPRFQPAERKSFGDSCAANSLPDPGPEEGLRLIRAFSRIRDPSRRARLIEEAEKIART